MYQEKTKVIELKSWEVSFAAEIERQQLALGYYLVDAQQSGKILIFKQ